MLYYVLVVPMLFIAGWVSSHCFPVSSMSYVAFSVAMFFIQILAVIGALQWLAVYHMI